LAVLFAMFSFVTMAQEVTVNLNVNKSGKLNLHLRCDYSVNVEGYVNVMAYICDGDGNGVPCENDMFSDADGNMCSSLHKSYIKAGNVTANIYIPNEVLHEYCESGSWYVFFVVEDCDTNERIYESEMYEFELE